MYIAHVLLMKPEILRPHPTAAAPRPGALKAAPRRPRVARKLREVVVRKLCGL